MKKIISLFLILGFVLVSSLFFIACGKNVKGEIKVEGNTEKYINKAYGFELKIDDKWENKYNYIEAGGNDDGEVLKFQVDFMDKDKEEKIKKKIPLDISFRIYVYDKEMIKSNAEKVKKDVKNYIKEECEQTYLGENDKCYFTVQYYNDMESIDKLFSVI
ncbi:hypothetical protein [Clostridium ganghwense]|uniref:Lipoprotein n=1 Tax=Clostridium ganghwense TaxID=312089 RepID=A0ABT4CQ72_9CLOT|nr:hypothetical protein [Clostridium ganghwense]MCY6371194.1 hypothetical protein [Clostridium ganghwense]